MNPKFYHVIEVVRNSEKDIQHIAQKVISDIFAVLFKELPKLKEVVWRQYASNDKFIVCKMDAFLNTSDIEEMIFTKTEELAEVTAIRNYLRIFKVTEEIKELYDKHHSNDGNKYRYGKITSELLMNNDSTKTVVANTIQNIENFIPPNIMRLAFGDSVEVHFTANGFTIIQINRKLIEEK